MGLACPAAHSHERQIAAMVELLSRAGGARASSSHLFDSRDIPPRSAVHAEFLSSVCASSPARASRLPGRYYAMDRDKRWERIAAAYDLLVDGRAAYSAPDPKPRSTTLTRAANPTSS